MDDESLMVLGACAILAYPDVNKAVERARRVIADMKKEGEQPPATAPERRSEG